MTRSQLIRLAKMIDGHTDRILEYASRIQESGEIGQKVWEGLEDNSITVYARAEHVVNEVLDER